MNRMNEELELEKEKLLKKLENNENDYKNTTTYSYQEHFKKMFVKFLEQLGQKSGFLRFLVLYHLFLRNSKDTEDLLKILCSIMKCEEAEKTVILQVFRQSCEVKEKKGMMSSLFGIKK